MQIVVMLLVSLFFLLLLFEKSQAKYIYWFVDNSLIQPVQKYDSLQAQGDWQKNAA